MRRLLAFLVSIRHTLLWLALQGVALALLVQASQPHHTAAKVVQLWLTSPLQQALGNLNSFAALQAENTQLMHETLALRKANLRLKQALLVHQFREPMKGDFMGVPDSLLNLPDYRFILGRVVQLQRTGRYNHLVLDRGQRHGLRPGMGLVAPSGAVGVVTETTESYALAMTLQNQNLRLSAKLLRTNVLGTLVWGGNQPQMARLAHIPRHHHPKAGDTVVTSGLGVYFPEGIHLGVVDTVLPDAGQGYLDVQVRLLTDFANLHLVYAVAHPGAQALRQLDQAARAYVPAAAVGAGNPTTYQPQTP